jgi:hypothetical protein
MGQKLAVQVEALEREEADLIYSNGYVFYDDNSDDESLVFANPEGHMRFGRINADEMFKFLFPINRIPILTVLVRKSALEQSGLFDESLRHMGHEDYDMWMRLALNKAIFYGIREPLAKYRIHPQAMSRNVINSLLAELEVFEKHRHAREIARSVRRERLRKLYKNAITALIENGMTGEARKYLLRQALRERFSLRPLADALLIGLLPQKHLAIDRFLQRIQASVAYRIGKPARSLISNSSIDKV